MRVSSLLCLLGLAASQPVPLPNLPDGFRVGTSGVVVETFMDLLCPDCAGDWPVMGQLLAHYGNKISLILHTFPRKWFFSGGALHRPPPHTHAAHPCRPAPPNNPAVPYHTFAFRLAQGAHVIASLNASTYAVFDFATLAFQRQGDFYGAGLNTSWVDNHIADLAATLGYDHAAVAAGLADDNLNEVRTKLSNAAKTKKPSSALTPKPNPPTCRRHGFRGSIQPAGTPRAPRTTW